MNVGYNPSHVSASNHNTTNESADAREITTEFIPLVQDASFAQLKLPSDSAKPVFVLKDVTDVSVWRSRPVEDAIIDRAGYKEL